MALDRKLYLEGVLAGPLTTSTAGPGDTPLDGLTGTGHTVVTAGIPGPAAMRFTQSASNPCSGYWVFSSRTTLFFRDYFYLKAPLVTTSNHVFFRVGAGVNRGMDMTLVGTGRFRLYNAANGSVAETATGVVLADTWYRREVTLTPSRAIVKLYLGDSATVAHTLDSGVLGAAEFGAAFDRITWGNVLTTPTAEPLTIDNVWLDTTTTPGAVASQAPVVDAGADLTNVEPYSMVTLDGSATDADGTVTSLVWSQTGGTPTVALTSTGEDTATFEAPGTLAGTTLTFTLTATDNTAATGTDTMTVTVLPVTERAVVGGVEVPMRVTAL